MANLQATTVSGTAAATTFSGNGSGITSLASAQFASATINNAQIAADGATRTKINYAGAVLQCNMIRYDARPSVSAPGNANGTALTQLRLSITPTYTNSLIVCEWYIHGEASSHDQGFRVGKNGTVVTTSGFQGYNNDTGQNNHSFITSDHYDANDDSTPNCSVLLYYDRPNTTSSIYYEPHVAAADGPARTWFFNRTVSSAGAGNQENGVSFGRIWEIKQ
jgi:hypothetical protein